MAKTLVIIPAYNEAENIKKTVNDLLDYINTTSNEVDYIIVNDCSTDNTLDVIKDSGYKHVSHVFNMGLDATVKTGIRYALEKKFDYVTQFDGDGQHLAIYIDDLITTMNGGYDIVIGSRFIKSKKHFSMRMLGSKWLSNIIYAKSGFKQKITDPTSGQRMINKEIQKLSLKENYASEPSFITKYLRANYKIKEIAVTMDEREFGESHFNFYSSIVYMLEQTIAIIFGY